MIAIACDVLLDYTIGMRPHTSKTDGKTANMLAVAVAIAVTYVRAYSAHLARKVKVPNSTVSLLTVTSKMPCPSFSLPARLACPNSHGTICEHCYADPKHGGCYGRFAVRNAQLVRFAWVRECMKSVEGRYSFVATMIRAIDTVGTPYFRIHDSGDFFSIAYLECWIQIAESMPHVAFWVPTREYQSKASTSLFEVLNPRMNALRRLAALPNVTVRPSALNIGEDAPIVAGLQAGSAVDSPNAFQCVARGQDGHCGDCRACWNEKSRPVSYPLH